MEAAMAQGQVPPGLALTPTQVRGYQNDIYTLLYLYLFVVLVNALSVVIVFWIRASGHFAAMPWSALTGWAVGSGGLGAGGLLFKGPLDRLFK
jgi:hypothetical protein